MPRWTKEQQEAIDKDGTNIIVSAGAGSGKTAVLSERVLRKLKSGVSIDNLLILTFTHAAADEMKERIRKKISGEKDLNKELDKIDASYITTFDSYALSIVKKYNYLLNVSKNISIIEKSIIDLKKKEILNEIFENLYEEINEQFLNLIDTFCTKDDEEIKKYIIEINNKLDMIYDKDSYLLEYSDYYYNDEFINNKIVEYENLLLKKVSDINNNIIKLEEFVDNEYYEKIQDELGELLISINYEDIKRNIKTISALPKNSEEEAKNIKEKISKSLKELTNMCSYEDKKEILSSIYKTKEFVSIIIDIIKKLDIKINTYKKENDLYEFIDIAKMAITIIKENEDIRNEIKNNFNEILIDEYQDTNDLQDLFISYIENNNVYMVGDIKQSIYRFRNANPNLFKQKYESYSNLDNGIKIDLNKNFRSREEVLDNINLIFDDVMNLEFGGADYKKTHRMFFGNNTYNVEGKTNQNNNLEIYSYPFDKNSKFTKEEIEIFIIANDIKNKIDDNYQVFDKDKLQKRNVNYSDFAILIDKSTAFNQYRQIFEYMNIPLSVYKDETIVDSVDLVLIKNIINLVINKKHDQSFKYSFISVLRSYLFNIDDNEIFKYFINNNYNESELINIISSIDYYNLNTKEIIEEIIEKFNFYENIISVGNIDSHIAVLDYIINLASSLSDIGYTIIDFYNYLEEVIENKSDIRLNKDSNNNGVKIMTIHKSKGLEFPICYYSGLYSKFNTSELKERFLFDKNFGIISPIFDNGIRNTIYKDLLKQDYLKEEIGEKIRLFYVALTRAKEKMILISPKVDEQNDDLKENQMYTSFKDIMDSMLNKMKPYTQNISLEELNLTKDYNLIKKNDYQNLIQPTEEKIIVNNINIEANKINNLHFSKEVHKLIDSKIYNNIELGKKIHSIFENIDFNNPDYSNLSDFEKDKIIKFINTGILNGFVNLYKEYEFKYEKDNDLYHGIIDLLIEFEDKFKIVDYKLKNITDEAYLRQLNGYKDYIESLTGKEVEIYLYSILDSNLKKM